MPAVVTDIIAGTPCLTARDVPKRTVQATGKRAHCVDHVQERLGLGAGASRTVIEAYEGPGCVVQSVTESSSESCHTNR